MNGERTEWEPQQLRGLRAQFQSDPALAQFDDRPGLKRALIGFYRSFANLLIELVRADAREKRGGR